MISLRRLLDDLIVKNHVDASTSTYDLIVKNHVDVCTSTDDVCTNENEPCTNENEPCTRENDDSDSDSEDDDSEEDDDDDDDDEPGNNGNNDNKPSDNANNDNGNKTNEADNNHNKPNEPRDNGNKDSDDNKTSKKLNNIVAQREYFLNDIEKINILVNELDNDETYGGDPWLKYAQFNKINPLLDNLINSIWRLIYNKKRENHEITNIPIDKDKNINEYLYM